MMMDSNDKANFIEWAHAINQRVNTLQNMLLQLQQQQKSIKEDVAYLMEVRDIDQQLADIKFKQEAEKNGRYKYR